VWCWGFVGLVRWFRRDSFCKKCNDYLDAKMIAIWNPSEGTEEKIPVEPLQTMEK
jgi:hypothetical protein